MKYYVDIVYIMIVNGVIISNDKNKNMLEKKNIKASGLSNVKTANGLLNVKKANGLSNVKRSNGLKSVKGGTLKILK